MEIIFEQLVIAFKHLYDNLENIGRLLNLEKEINIIIAIVRAFIALKKIFPTKQSKRIKKEVEKRLCEHEVQLTQIYNKRDKLLDKKPRQRKKRKK